MEVPFQRKNDKTNIFWLINLRWIAAGSVLATVSIVHFLFRISLNIIPLYSIAMIIALYNLIFTLITRRLIRETVLDEKAITRIINLQVVLDLISLLSLIHFSGGIENPFIFYFIFHTIIASILLSRRDAFIQTTFVVVLFLLLVVLEYLEILPHYRLEGFIPFAMQENPLYIIWMAFAFVSTIYIAAYMATAVARQLRENRDHLAMANEQLLEKDKIKNSYVLRVTHDIKGHISAIESCINPVLEGYTGEINEKQKQLLLRATNRTGTGLNYIHELLKVTKVKLLDKLEFENINLNFIVDSINGEFEDLSRAKNIDYQVGVKPDLPLVRGIALYIKEMLLNFLTNAVKYTPREGRVSLEILEEEDCIAIEIKDTGIGIPVEELPYIFDEFFRAKNALSVEKNGTGLGLSFCKHIVDMHRGRVTVQSEVGKGTMFRIELPKT